MNNSDNFTIEHTFKNWVTLIRAVLYMNNDHDAIVDEFMTDIKEWLTNNIPANDYKWSDWKFTIHVMRVQKTYSSDIYFRNAEDMLAFKLKFGL